MDSHDTRTPDSKALRWTALALCAAVLVAGAVQPLMPIVPSYTRAFAPDGIAVAAAVLAAAGIVRLNGRARWPRVHLALLWSGLLLMVWAASGLPLDLLRLTPLMPFPVDWPGLVTKSLALATAVALARLALARPATAPTARPATWYGYAAFVLALPYPVLRTLWALGSTIGLARPGAGGQGWAPWLIGIPWMLAAAMSLLLVRTPRWMPRWLLLTAGWTATAIVGMIGPAACWALVSAWLSGGGSGPGDIATWVFGLFYGSWLLFAIAAGAATRAYQLRSARAQSGPWDELVRVSA
jgi:MFS transporter, DHA1 family, inner membrane transport protein